MQDKRFQSNSSFITKFKRWISPISFLRHSLLSNKELDELKLEFYRKTLMAIIARTIFFVLALVNGTEIWDKSKAMIAHENHNYDVGFVEGNWDAMVLTIKIIKFSRLILVALYYWFPWTMRTTMILDSAIRVLEAFFPVDWPVYEWMFVGIDMCLNYCGDFVMNLIVFNAQIVSITII